MSPFRPNGSKTRPYARTHLRRTVAVVTAAAAVLGPVSGLANPASATAASKLIIFTLPFPCNLNAYASQLCAGVSAEGKALKPGGFRVEVKTGTNYSDVSAYNNLLQTSYQLGLGGVIAFVNGPAAQTPTLLAGCAKGIKVILIDSPATGMGKCQSSFVGSNHFQMGVDDGKWLIAHPPADHSKEVGVVTQPPGRVRVLRRARPRGFSTTVEAAGYKIVATEITNLVLDQTRNEVTNMLTAHPNIGAIFAANGPMGNGALEGLTNHPSVELLTLDGDTPGIQGLEKGTVAVDTVQNPYAEGTISVKYMSEVILGKSVPKLTYTTAEVVDKANVAKYIASGGPR